MRTMLAVGAVAALAGSSPHAFPTRPRTALVRATLPACDAPFRLPVPATADEIVGSAAASPPPDLFRARIAPLLAQKCAPCHNPGGKMYPTMPFDDPATITSHAEGVLRRIKTPEEHTLIEEWIASQPKP